MRNRNDNATRLSADSLVHPLSDWLDSGKAPGWECPTWWAADATKASLHQQFKQEAAPAILFTASHGVGYDNGDPLQKDFQGALVCQEWSPFSGEPDPETHLFSAADIPSDADLHGLIAFHFACYGLGTPQYNDFRHHDGAKVLADAPFIARLPQTLLSHPKGGALAVIGHVDRAFSDSFRVAKIQQLQTFQSVLKCLVDRRPVGYALEFFNQQYAELASDCNLGIRNGDITDKDLAALWTGSTNARNYAIFGDPAVTVAVEQDTSDQVVSSALEAKVWFAPSGKPTQPPNNQIGEVHSSDAEKTLTERLAQLEKQVQSLQLESASMKQELENLKRQLETPKL